MRVRGDLLNAEARRDALQKFNSRWTGDHTPTWARKSNYKGPHYATDQDWLADTDFLVTKSGRLDERARFCYSHLKPDFEETP